MCPSIPILLGPTADAAAETPWSFSAGALEQTSFWNTEQAEDR